MNLFASIGMEEVDAPSVQGLPRDCIAGAVVGCVASKRMADGGEVDADLVGAAGQQMDLEQGI